VRWHAAHSHRSDLIAQGVSRGLSHQDAEDIASESVLRAALKEDLDLERAGGWLRTVAHHLAVDLHRAHLCELTRERLRSATVEIVEPQASVDDRLEAEWVASIVDALPDRQRRALHLRAAGLTVDEIAERMDSTYKTAESLISRARAAVRKAIGATLGLWGLLMSPGRRRGVLAPSLAGAAVAASVTVWCGMGDAPAIAGTQQGAGATQPLIAQTAAHAATVRRPHKGPGSALAPEVVDTQPTTARVLPSGHVGPLRHGGVSVTRSHPDESLVASVERCLAEGVALNPGHVGCQ
jgi:RNA polymerase sigma factor (sigma-70 family)